MSGTRSGTGVGTTAIFTMPVDALNELIKPFVPDSAPKPAEDSGQPGDAVKAPEAQTSRI